MVNIISTASLPRLANAYKAAGALTASTYTAVAIKTLSYHPHLDLPLRHNVLTIAQALAPLPLVLATFAALSSAASAAGMPRLKSATYRRLNLAAATASLWLAAASLFAPLFAVGYKLLTPSITTLVTSVHLTVAALCLKIWANSVTSSPKPISGHYVPRILRGVIGSLWSLPPALDVTGAAHDDPDKSIDGRALYATACAGFVWFAIMPCLVAFPLATVPTILGKRLSRAASAWTFLSAVAAYVLKDGAERGRLHASTFRTIRRGLAASSGIHLFVVALKLAGADGGRVGLLKYYPAAMSCPKASLCSLAVHAIAVYAALTPPPLPPEKEVR